MGLRFPLLPRSVRTRARSRARGLSIALAGAASVALSPFVFSNSGCSRAPDVRFVITVAPELAQPTQWFEVGAYRAASCAALEPMLTGGLVGAFQRRVGWRRSDVAPSVGDLPPDRYAFGAIAKDAECGVLAVGCSEADIRDSSEVKIALRATSGTDGQALGKCGVGSTCNAAQCMPIVDNGNSNLGPTARLRWSAADRWPIRCRKTLAAAFFTGPRWR